MSIHKVFETHCNSRVEYCNTNCMTHKIYDFHYLTLYRKSLLTFSLEDGFRRSQQKVQPWEVPRQKNKEHITIHTNSSLNLFRKGTYDNHQCLCPHLPLALLPSPQLIISAESQKYILEPISNQLKILTLNSLFQDCALIKTSSDQNLPTF